MKRGFKTKCEKRAKNYRTQLGLQKHDPLPAKKLANLFDVVVVSPEDIPELDEKDIKQLINHDSRSWSALTIMVGEIARFAALIIQNPTHSAARRESNLLHELSHLILEHKPDKFVALDGLPFTLREYNSDDEEAAKWLGGCLHLPRPALVWALARSMKSADIMEHYNASEEMVRYRRNMTGVDKQFRRFK